MSKTVSIIGCGWLGLPLAESLLKKQYIVKGSTTTEQKITLLAKKKIRPYLLKLHGKNITCDDYSIFACDILYINLPPGRRRRSVQELYPEEIKILLNQAAKFKVGHIIFISSTSVYPQMSGEIDENTELNPLTESGKALKIAEEIVKDNNANYTILRFAGLFGLDRQPSNWFKGRTNIPGGDCPVNMVHLDDCITISQLIIAKPDKAINEVYNICADMHPVKKVFYERHSINMNVKVPEFLDGCDYDRRIDNRKFKNQFAYSYLHPDPSLV